MSTDATGTGMAGGGKAGGGARRSRRVLLTGAAAALGVVTAETLGSAAPAQATQGSAVLEGADNTGATRRTAVFTTGNNEWGTLADPNTSGNGSVGVYGHGQDHGVYGDAGPGGSGLAGTGGEDSGIGVFGIGGVPEGTGVVGIGGNSATVGGTGVFGNGTGSSPGVSGTGGSGGGDGVVGVAGGTGSGVLAQNTGAGPALTVEGPALFSTAGVLTVSAGKSSVTKTGVTLTGSSLIFATLQQNHSGVWVQSAVPDVSGSSFTVHVNKAVTASTTVAWFVVN